MTRANRSLFSSGRPPSTSNDKRGLVAGDFDGDGVADVALCASSFGQNNNGQPIWDHYLQVWNTGSNEKLSPAWSYPESCNYLMVAHLDEDGKLDLVGGMNSALRPFMNESK